jgi:hypothetical protein
LQAVIPLDQRFITSQRKSLQTISSLYCNKRVVQSLFGDFPKLTTLELADCSDFIWTHNNYNNPIPTNKTIQNMKLQLQSDGDGKLESFSVCCREILSALPELVNLDIEIMTTELMKFIALNLPKLKALKCDSIEDGAWDRYDDTKREGVEGVNEEIQLSIVMKED